MKIAIAAVFGGILGFEREWHGRPAGLRTNILISIASCLFTILSIVGFPLHGNAQDTARIAAQIVTGVGFLGAGTLMHSRNRVKGLTTAATVWLVSAVGMTVGIGAYGLALFTTILAAVVLQLLHPVSQQIKEHRQENSREAQPKPAKTNGGTKPE